MASRKPARQVATSEVVPGSKPPAAAVPTFEPAPPLQPRPKLLAVLALVLGAWVGFLVFLYFKTPRPLHVVPHANTRAADSE